MNAVPHQERRRPAAVATASSPATDEAKKQGVREPPATAEEKHEEHVDEPGYGHGV